MMMNKQWFCLLLILLISYCLVHIVITGMLLMNDINRLCVIKPILGSEDYCEEFPLSIGFDSAVLGIVVITTLIWLVSGLLHLMKIVSWEIGITQSISKNNTLQTIILEKTIEITNLERQLHNKRNGRRPTRVDNSLLLRREQGNEREHLLPRRDHLTTK